MQYDKENNRTVGVLCLYLSYDDIKAMQNDTKYEYYHKWELRQIDYLFILDDLAYDVDFVFDKSDDRENRRLWYVMTDSIYPIEELIN